MKVGLVGICETDRRVYAGELPVADGLVLGHEVAGWVDGIPVVVHPGLCSAFPGVGRDGALAEWIAVPEAAVFETSLPLSLAVWAEPVCAVLGALQTLAGPPMIAGQDRISVLYRRIFRRKGISCVPDGIPVRPRAVSYGSFEEALAILRSGPELVADLCGSQWRLTEHRDAFAYSPLKAFVCVASSPS